MLNTNEIFQGNSEYLDEVIILPVGSHGAGSYNLPAGYLWTDFESVEIVYGRPTENDAFSTRTLPKEFIQANPTDWIVRMNGVGTGETILVNSILKATSINTMELTDYTAAAGALKCVKGYIKKYGTRNHSKTVSVNGGANIAVNSRYEIDIATELGADYLNRDLVVVAEIYYDGSSGGVAGWGNTGTFWSSSTSIARGVRAEVLDNKIVVQSGLDGIMAGSNLSGSPFGNTSGVTTPVPARVKVWKVDEYLPATKSSGDITTIWTGSAGNGVTVDWSGTSYVLSQFDAILIVSNISGGSKGSVVLPPSELVGYASSIWVVPYTSTARARVGSITETSLQAITDGGYLITGVYGINYN
jgi:hypothetical protein